MEISFSFTNFLIFRIAETTCAIPCELIREIVAMPLLVRSPGCPPIVEGFLNLRSQAVPILMLRRLFDLPIVDAEIHTPVVILEAGKIAIGLIVDEVIEITAIEPANFRELDKNRSFNECAKAEFTHANQAAVLLDCDRLLLVEEQTRVAELQHESQRRLAELQKI
jgi:purine-binding chemotaxis protein CheW